MNGLLLGYKERNLETNVLYTSTMYYDDRKRMVNSNSENHVGGKDRISINYSFTGEILKSLKTTDKGTTASKITEISEYLYDHLGRKVSYVLNGKPIAKYEYDAIGRLKGKRFSPSGTTQNSKQTGNWTDASNWLSGLLPNANDNVTINTGHTLTIPSGQIAGAGILNDRGILRNFGTLNMGKFSITDLYNQTLSYHIRGGLRGLNLDASGNLTNALFSMKIFYEDDLIYFDGNIRKQEWKTGLDNVTRSFTYRYDGASRIKAGVYLGTGNENYTLADVNYDNNGNIKKLIRNGLIATNTFGIIDNLNYTYNPNSNKILKVDDLSNVTASFTDVVGNDYTYSADGSLASDANKGISTIEYNYLKLPKKVVQNGVTTLIQYSASGKKLKETIGSNTTDYVGNVIYQNSNLYQISHDEGRIIDGQYEYNLKDHLGNLRVAFRDSLGSAKITQSNSYGIFGEDLTTLNYLKQTWKADNFKFTGKESLQGTGFIDFGARWYDNIVPRFITIDPLAETSRRFSPFTYGNNNPIRFIDPDGMESKGYEYSDGYSTLNSANETGSVSHEGAFLNAGGGGDDKPKVNTTSSNNSKAGTRTIGTSNGNKSNLKSNNQESWRDSDLLRWIPDIITVGGGFSGIGIIGAGTSVELNWITRGPDASLLPVLSTTQSLGGGYSIDATVNLGFSYYIGPSNEINREIIKTNIGEGGVTYWAGGGLSAGGKLGGTIGYTPATSPTPSGSIGSLVSLTGSFGVGLPAGPLPFNAASGISNTFILKDFKKKK
jgi:RHS repeat-associated protein